MGQFCELIAGATAKHGSAGKDKTIAFFCEKWGMARRNVLEYLRVQKDLGKIIEEDGKLRWENA